MNDIRSNLRNKGKFLNYTFLDNEKSNTSNENPVVNCFTLHNQKEFGESPNINLNNSKRFEYLRECYTQTNKNLAGEKGYSFSNRSNDNYLSSKNKIFNNYYEGDSKSHYMPELTHEYLASLPFDRMYNVVNFMNQDELSQDQKPASNSISQYGGLLSGSALTKAFLEKSTKLKRSATGITSFNQNRNPLRSHSYVCETSPCINSVIFNPTEYSQAEYNYPEFNQAEFNQAEFNPPEEDFVETESKPNQNNVTENTQTDLKEKPFSFMSPTIASKSKNQSLDIKNIESLISPTRKSKSISPKRSVNHTNRNPSPMRSTKEKEGRKSELGEVNSLIDIGSRKASNTSTGTSLYQAVNKLRDSDWILALRGLAEIIEICKTAEPELILPHMTIVNQKLISLIKSPRSHVSRTACQATGHIFEYVKDTRRPEFDELVDSLLCKCADCNRFIRHDANLALDCMVTHIPTFHAVRAICAKGPEHKNALVRTAAARILVCAIVLAGPQNIVLPSANEYTKRRIIMKMAGFLEDRNPEVRKYGERIYKMLSKDKTFDMYLNRFLETDVISKMRKIMKHSEYF
ncbi:unnamed protein product [Phyllotreta striolata]|uniref:TOG domain-containing protein n=1 Tax=Phyllotreta striolata TaxID=444603 RepID=A0A9N9XR05_PHYSR|nr:unnamed protein product [Phyllotreta striolata]